MNKPHVSEGIMEMYKGAALELIFKEGAGGCFRVTTQGQRAAVSERLAQRDYSC